MLRRPSLASTYGYSKEDLSFGEASAYLMPKLPDFSSNGDLSIDKGSGEQMRGKLQRESA